ncbi:MAG TPA: RNA polymerase sigma factor [Saprospiraceae bacterium]|nr:RNA polymerase sigma factor [Saprospiraceae bacterium]
MLPIQQIIHECIKGDRAAQKQLYYALVDDLLMVAHRYTRDASFAHDVVQNTFIRIYSNLSTYQPEIASLHTWAKKICVYEAIAFLRKNQKHTVNVSIEDVLIPFKTDCNHENETVETLTAKIQALPDEHRMILNLYFFEEMSHKEIAALLQIQESSSRSRLSRAKDQLRINWKAAFFFLLIKTWIYGS